MGKVWLSTTGMARAWPGAFHRIAGGHEAVVNIHSGGGSTILLGLLALAAVVGWRSRTRIGGFLRDQMLAMLGITVVLGIVLSNFVDNFGHAGGAIAGALVGFAHRPLIRLGERRWARRAGWGIVACLLMVCVGAGVLDDRSDVAFERGVAAASERLNLDFRVVQDLDRLYVLYGRTISRSPIYRTPYRVLDLQAMDALFPNVNPPNRDPAAELEQVPRDRLELVETLDQLDHVPDGRWGVEVRADLDRIRVLGRASLEDVPRFDQAYEFIVCFRSAHKAIVADRGRAQESLVELSRIRK